jgi:hypothetical protein
LRASFSAMNPVISMRAMAYGYSALNSFHEDVAAAQPEGEY